MLNLNIKISLVHVTDGVSRAECHTVTSVNVSDITVIHVRHDDTNYIVAPHVNPQDVLY